MDQEKWDALDNFFCDALLAPDDSLEAALVSSSEAGLRPINVAPNQGKFLHLLAKIHGARRILEIGTLGGYSAIWMARALPPDGMLLSLELNPDYAQVARANLARAGVSSVASVVVGAAAESLQGWIDQKAEPFDMVFIDADKQSYPDYLRLPLELLRPGGIILADNVVRNGKIVDPDNHEEDVVGLRRFFKCWRQIRASRPLRCRRWARRGGMGFLSPNAREAWGFSPRKESADGVAVL